MKVIFLDIDGVLNSVESAMVYKSYQRLNPVCVGLLERLVENTGAKIVISSSWRIGHENLDSLRENLRRAGLTEPLLREIIDRTAAHANGHRGDEVGAWLNEHIGEVEAYVILDDDSDFHPGQVHVHTCNTRGLCLDDYLQCLRHLKAEGTEHPDLRKMTVGQKMGWRDAG